MKTIFKHSLLMILLAAASLGLSVQASEKAGLVQHMGNMQKFMHKAGLSLKAGNVPLAKFYIHEIEEVVEKLEDYGTYKKHDISHLVESLFDPRFEKFEDDVKSGDLQKAWSSYNELINTCNECHRTTEFEFIHIQFNENNPYMQSFEPVEHRE